VLVSSQLIAGGTRRLQAACDRARPGAGIEFAYSPENLPLGSAISVFLEPDRIVVGAESARVREVVSELVHPFQERISAAASRHQRVVHEHYWSGLGGRPIASVVTSEEDKLGRPAACSRASSVCPRGPGAAARDSTLKRGLSLTSSASKPQVGGSSPPGVPGLRFATQPRPACARASGDARAEPVSERE